MNDPTWNVLFTHIQLDLEYLFVDDADQDETFRQKIISGIRTLDLY